MKVRKNTKRWNIKVLLAGVFLLLLSLLPYILKTDAAWGLLLAIFHIIYDLGVVMVSDVVIQRYYGYSLIGLIIKNKKNLMLYLVTTTIGGFLLEFFADYLGSYWYYPFWSNELYYVLFIPGFAVYFSAVTFSYWAAKAFFDDLFKGKTKVTKSYKFEKWLYRIFLVIALAGLAFLAYRITTITNWGQSFSFNVTSIRPPYIDFMDVFIAFLVIFLGGEYLEYKTHKSSFIKDTIHGYFTPLIAILFSATTLALYMEIQNIPLNLWIYINIPLQNIQILGLPILLFLGWPLHYVGFLSIYRIIGANLTREIWAGDKIR